MVAVAGPIHRPRFVRHIHYHLKAKLIDELRPQLGEWSGYEPGSLEMTSIYGIRRYTRGSVLRMHVDTVTTHVVSAIINVEQEGVDEDWPLEIKSHDGQYHYVNMKPGEVPHPLSLSLGRLTWGPVGHGCIEGASY